MISPAQGIGSQGIFLQFLPLFGGEPAKKLGERKFVQSLPPPFQVRLDMAHTQYHFQRMGRKSVFVLSVSTQHLRHHHDGFALSVEVAHARPEVKVLAKVLVARFPCGKSLRLETADAQCRLAVVDGRWLHEDEFLLPCLFNKTLLCGFAEKNAASHIPPLAVHV